MWWWALVACGTDPVEQPSDVAPAELPVAVAPAEVTGYAWAPTALDAAGSVGDVTWDPGDGAAPVSGEAVAHTYRRPGLYTATVTATVDGVTATASVVVTIGLAPDAPVPVASAPLAAAADGRVFVVMPDFDRVAVYDPTTEAVTHLATCPRPRQLALTDDGGLAVACEDRRPAVQLWRVPVDGDAVLEAERTFADRGATPTGLLMEPDGGLVVALRQRSGPEGALLWLDGSLATVDEAVVGEDLRALAHGDGALFAARFRSGPGAGALYRVADGVEAWPLPAATSLGDAPEGVPNLLGALAVRPDHRAIAVGGLLANVGRGVFLDGRALTPTTTVHAELRLVSVHPDAAPLGAALARADGLGTDRVAGLAFNADGTVLYATHPGSEQLTVHDGYDLSLRARIPLDARTPEGVVVAGADVWVEAPRSRQLLRVRPDAAEADRVEVIDLLPPEGEVVDPLILAGDILFHRSADPRMSVDGSTSCASCHPDGEQDGQNWDFTQFGEGVRNTQTLRGLGRFFSPLHWTGNFDEVQDFEQVMRNAQGGLGMLADADWLGPAGDALGAPKAGLSPDLDALAAYVLSLDLLDVPWDLPPGTTDQGFFAFIEGGCQNCHPNGGTDSHWQDDGTPKLHDIGSATPASGQRIGAPLTGFDSPPLAGLWATPPYDHDGAAPTLNDSLNDSTILHGDAGEFRPDDHAAVMLYLRTL
jgi:hypothetical protein